MLRVVLFSLFATSLFAADTETQKNLDIIWILIAAALVFLMQAGFTAFESGMVRAKNSINVAVKNFADLTFAIIAFFILGYGFMFGSDSGGIIGTSNFLLHGKSEGYDYAFFIFQAVFAGTAATIISGAVAERMQFSGYIVISILVSGIIYPISGHWVWGDGGWLANMGFVDFAGSTVVHSVGAWLGLVGAYLLGPRIGRFTKNGKVNKIHESSLQTATVGVFILWFGWFGFNGGSTLVGDGSVAKVIVNTNIAAAIGGIVAFGISKLIHGQVQVSIMLNGGLAGLVAITAGCAAVEPSGALIIGAGAGVVVVLADIFLLNVLKIDDPVSVVAVHGVSGAWGTLALALVAPVDALPAGSMLGQLWVQFVGVAAIFFWSIIMGFILFGGLKMIGKLRVNEEHEKRGLNESEHGAKQTLNDTFDAMSKIVTEGDFQHKIEEELGTEAGEIALVFNQMVEELKSISHVAQQVAEGDLSVQFTPKHQNDQLGNAIFTMISELNNLATNLKENTSHMGSSVDELDKNNQQFQKASSSLSAGIEELSNNAVSSKSAVEDVNRSTSEGMQALDSVVNVMNSIHESMDTFSNNIKELDSSVDNIGAVVESINDIAEQTNLLALNAAIEAARAGEHGRGFAVVADEVRKLAEKTQHSLKEVEISINALRQNSATAIDESSSMLERINDGTKQVEETSSIFSTIQTSMSALQSQIDKVSTIVGEQVKISEVSKKVADTITNVVESLSGDMHNMRQVVGRFRT